MKTHPSSSRVAGSSARYDAALNAPHCRNLSSKSVVKNIQVGSLDIVKLYDGRMVEAKVTAIR
jgi:hypothetical protein